MGCVLPGVGGYRALTEGTKSPNSCSAYGLGDVAFGTCVLLNNVFPYIMHTHILALPMYNAHPYFFLKNLVKK